MPEKKALSLSYEEMLERALARLPKGVVARERFVPPQPHCLVIGNRTVLSNLREICDKLDRPYRHVVKFLAKELATASSSDGVRATFQGIFSAETIARLLNRYIDDYVICPVCHRPDTFIAKEKRFTFLICKACGAKSSIRPL